MFPTHFKQWGKTAIKNVHDTINNSRSISEVSARNTAHVIPLHTMLKANNEITIDCVRTTFLDTPYLFFYGIRILVEANPFTSYLDDCFDGPVTQADNCKSTPIKIP